MSQTSTPAHHKGVAYRPDIDGLRAIAVLLVVAFHADAVLVPGGYIGVDVFFVISGFLISKIIYTDTIESRFSYLEFYRRRIKRLLPAFTLVVATVFVLGLWLSLPDHLLDTGQSMAAAGFFSTNILFWREAGYFDGPAELKPLLHSWSLGVEEQFYFIYPTLLLIGLKLWRRHGALGVTAAIFVVSLAASALLTSSYPQAAFFLLPFRAWELMLGSLLAIAAPSPPSDVRLRTALVAAGLLMIAIGAWGFSSATPFPGVAAMLPVGGSGLLLFAAGRGDPISRAVLENPVSVYIGRISYSLYLWHWPLLAYTHYRFIGEVPIAVIAGMVALAFVLASLSYHFVEQPFRKRDRMVGWWPFLFAVASSAAMIGAGAALVITKGLPQRFSGEVRTLIDTRSGRDKARDCMVDEAGWDRSAEPCTYGASGVPASIALWGDSHAHALVEALGDAAAARQKTVRFYGFAGCPPLPQVETPGVRDCTQFTQKAEKDIIADDGIKTVVLFARHSVHLLGDTAAFGPAEAGLGPAAFPDLAPEERERRYLAAFGETVGQLLAAGKRVVIVEPVPEVAYDVPRTAALLKLRGDDAANFTRPRRIYDERQRVIRTEMERWGRDPRVTLVDPAAWMCDADRCFVSQDGNLLYYDDDHVSRYAADRISRDIFRKLDAED